MAGLHDGQKNPNEINSEIAGMKPHEYYNKFIRLEGQKVLDEQEYAEKVKKQREGEKTQSALYQQYPLTPEDAIINTGKSD